MRLSYKVFTTSTLVILALVGVATWSSLAISRLVDVIGNAIRFTPHGGAVTVRLADVGPLVVIGVEDTGVGIPANDLRRILDPYEQAHRGRGDSGLGLAIVKGLVELHGGQVEVESEEGRESRFLVRLPLVGAPLVGTAPPGVEQ